MIHFFKSTFFWKIKGSFYLIEKVLFIRHHSGHYCSSILEAEKVTLVIVQ